MLQVRFMCVKHEALHSLCRQLGYFKIEVCLTDEWRAQLKCLVFPYSQLNQIDAHVGMQKSTVTLAFIMMMRLQWQNIKNTSSVGA